MGQSYCSTNVGVAAGAGHSLWAGFYVHRLRKLMAFCQFWMAIELEDFLCVLICGFCFLSGMSIALIEFELHPGE